jgi:predicted dehydrogenase
LRFAVIGCGDIGLHNAVAISGAANAEVALSHDAAPGLAAAVAERCGGEVAPSLEAALDRSRVDAVFLSVPHDAHVSLAVRAAEAGLHVAVEKPLAADLAGAERAVAAAAAAGVALSVCFPFRYEPAVLTARALVCAGALGPLRGATVVFHADKPPSYWRGGFSGRASSDWRGRRDRAGGGVLIMNLTHYVDFIRFVTGVEPEWVSARTDPGAEVEDAVALSVGFEGGAVGTISGSASTRGIPPNRFELWGEVGALRIEPDPAVYTDRALDGVATGRWVSLPRDAGDDPRRIFVERFADAVLRGRPPEVTADDGLAVQSFVDAAYRSIRDKCPIRLDARRRVPA